MPNHLVHDLLRRLLGAGAALALLVIVLVGAASAAPEAADVTTLTLAKETSPAGGTDFPVSAVGFTGIIRTSFSSPRDIVSDLAGNLYVVGFRAGKVQVFDSAGSPLRTWGTKGKGPDELFRPDDLAVVDDGVEVTVIVADTGNNRLQVFDDEGNHIESIGGPGSGDGQFNGPQGVVTDAAGNIIVADTNNQRIQVFDSAGNFVRTWGSEGDGDGEFSYPAGVDVGPDGYVYVVDSNNHRIQVFDIEGTFIRTWGTHGNQPGQFNLPTHITIGPDGQAYVSDTYNNRVQKLTREGRFLTMWGTQGTGPGQFERPNGIVVSPEGVAHVVDIDNARIEKFQQLTAFLDDGEEAAFDLPSVTYQVTEPAIENWELTGVVCEGGDTTDIDNGVTIAFEDAVPARCTFTNASTATTGSVAVTKYHDLDQDGSNSAGDIPLGGWTFRVRDDQGTQIGEDMETDVAGSILIEDLLPGDYQICELLPAGWFNTEPGDAGQPISGTGGEVCADAEVVSGVVADVAFGNVEAAALTVVKVTDPADAGPFLFTSDVPDLNGSLFDGEQLSAIVWPGTYTVTESGDDDTFYLSALTCDDTDSTGDLAAMTATFQAAPGESVTCTFTNSEIQDGSVSVRLYEDVDDSGDESAGDLPLSGWTVRLRASDSNLLIGELETDAAGMVSFVSLEPGPVKVCQVLPEGWDNVDPGDNGQPIVGSGEEVCVDVDVVADQVSEVVFGNVPTPEPGPTNLYLPMMIR